MMNIDKITSMLRRLEPVNRPEAVQQYAQQHKDNYIIMSLALSEANRRKDALAAKNLNIPPSQKVNDQALASMAAPMPENVGIGQLPAGNMNFADGGIVAFSDGGDVPRYQSQGLVRPGPGLYETDPKLAKEAAERARIYRDFYRLGRSPFGTAAGAAGPAAALSLIPAGMAQGLVSAMDYMRAQGYPVDPMGEFGTGAATPEQASFDEDRRQRLLQTQAQKRAEDARLNAAVEGRPAPAAPAAAPLASPDADFPSAARTRAAAPKPDTGARGPDQRTPPAGGPELLGGPGAASSSDQSIYSLASTPSTYQREFDQFLPQGKVTDPFEADVRAQGAAEEKAARDYATRRKEQLEGLGALGAEQEKRLKAREEKLGKQEGELGPLALLQAGFAMMSGASPNALQNIGIGAQAGLKRYSEGAEKLDAAREKIDDAFGRLEIARRSEKMLTDKEMAEVDRDADKVVSQTRRDVLSSARAAYGLSHAQAGKMFDAYVADKRLGAELGSRERISREQMQNQLASAKITAGAQQGLYQALGSAAPGSPLLKGYELAKQEGQIPRLYSEYSKLIADPIKGPEYEQKFPTFQAWLAGMGGAGGGGGFVKPPANATVLKPPGT